MVFSKPADSVAFAKESLEESYLNLEEGNWLKVAINKSIIDMKENAFCGEPIRKNLIPKEYIKLYKINNLWWYPLPNAWRLLYSLVTPENKELLAIIIEFMNHKDYERRF
ncbi:MAG: hypothetical protein AABW79_02830 [Nanoarchaeota archaeon]